MKSSGCFSRKERAAMKKAIRRPVVAQEVLAQLRLPLADLMRSTLLDTVITAGSLRAIEMLEQQREALCGPKHAQTTERQAYRHGSCAGSLVMGGRRVVLPRPRVRSVEGRELELPAWKQWSDEDPLEQRALAQLILGVSTRGYAGSLERLPVELPERGKSRSAVSRRFVQGTQKQLAKLLQCDLSHLKLAVLMIDGVHFEDHVVLAALGIDESGNKHVLGLWEGATENARACKGLLEDLVTRGLATDRAMLVVLDGAKALHKAVKDVFASRALIQRCQEHKKRNVADQLPESMRPSVRRAMSEAYESSDAKRGLRLLENLAARLDRDHPGAAASLREGDRPVGLHHRAEGIPADGQHQAAEHDRGGGGDASAEVLDGEVRTGLGHPLQVGLQHAALDVAAFQNLTSDHSRRRGGMVAILR